MPKLKIASEEYCPHCENVFEATHVVQACPECGADVTACDACVNHAGGCGDCVSGSNFRENLALLVRLDKTAAGLSYSIPQLGEKGVTQSTPAVIKDDLEKRFGQGTEVMFESLVDIEEGDLHEKSRTS